MRSALLLLLAAGCYNVDSLTAGPPANDMAFSNAVDDLAGADFSGVDFSGVDLATNSDAGVPMWLPVSSGVKSALRALAADGDTLYVVGEASTILRIAADNKVHSEDPGPGFNLRGAAAAGGDVWAVGDTGTLLHRQTGSWQYSTASEATLYAAFGLGAADFVSVGSGGHFDHNQVEEQTASVLALFGVFARSGGDVFAVGESGTIIHRGPDGGAPDSNPWTALNSNTIRDLHGIHGNSSTLLAAGASGTVLRSDDSTAWSAETSGSNADLFAVWLTDADAFAAGDKGVILHRKAGVWSVEHTGGPALRAVIGRSASDVWAAGDDGTILHRAQ